MPTHLSLEQHLEALARGGAALAAAAAAAAPDAKVPTCPAWDVTDLVVHQGMVHRWAAANLRGERDHDTAASQAKGRAAARLLDWYADGLAALIDTVRATPDDAKATVFLKDAPPPRRFWARRQAHETTIHGVDAVAAARGRWPTAADVDIDPALASDGIDELLMGFITRARLDSPDRRRAGGDHPGLDRWAGGRAVGHGRAGLPEPVEPGRRAHMRGPARRRRPVAQTDPHPLELTGPPGPRSIGPR